MIPAAEIADPLVLTHLVYPGDHPDPANSQVQVDQLSHPLIRPTFSPKPCAFSETPAFHHRRVPLGEFRLP